MNIFSKIKLLWKMNRLIGDIKEVSKMKKFSVHVIIQILAIVSTYAGQVAEIVPDEYGAYIYGGISLIQGIIGAYNHWSNPDGTPVEKAYVKK